MLLLEVGFMSTRMEKYEKVAKTNMSRTVRNRELYETINQNEINNYEIKSNTMVLGSNEKNQIDVEQIKKILDTRYNEMPRRRNIKIETNLSEPPQTEEETKEYDINAVIEKARFDKPVSYEDDRVKKLRDTQFNILNNLNVDKEEKSEEKESETKLLDLINTITINEEKVRQSSDENDLFADLKGDDNTEVYEGMQEKVTEEAEALNKEKEKLLDVTSTASLTNSIDFSKRDFEDLDLDSDKIGVIGKIIIGLLFIVFLVGIYFFTKAIFNF